MLNFIINKFYNLKLQQKLIIMFGTLISIFWLIQIIALSLNFEIYDQKLYYNSLQNLVFYSEKIDNSIKKAEELILEVSLSPELQENLLKLEQNAYSSSEYDYYKYLFKSILIGICNDNEFVENFIYTNLDNELFQVGVPTETYTNYVYTDFINNIHKNNNPFTLSKPSENFQHIILGRDIKETKLMTLNYLGTLLMTYNLSGLIEKEYQSFVNDKSILFVYNADTMIFKSSDIIPSLPEFKNYQGYEIIKYNNEKYLMCYHKSSTYDLMYVNLIPYSIIYGQTALMKTIASIVFTLIFISMIFLIKKLSETITSPLEILHNAMKVVKKGDFHEVKKALPEKKYNDEIGILVENFDIMLNEIDYLINENFKKQILLKDTKYQMLQSQINPHFLYNTLNTINWMARSGDTNQTGKIIVNLGSLLRYSLDESQYVTVSSEIDAVRHYINIQLFRYKNRVNFDIQTNGDLEKYFMPKMILQPLVENAIQYGVENSLNFCNITVKVTELENEILMYVIDDGIGMNKEELENVKIFNFIPKGHGIGLKNINERLTIKYGENFNMNISSELNKGTKIKIAIPKNMEDSKNV